MSMDNKNSRNLSRYSGILSALLVTGLFFGLLYIIDLTNFRFGEFAGISGSDWFKFFGGAGIFGVSVFTLVHNIKKHREVSKMQSLDQDIENWIKFVELAGIKDKSVALDLLDMYEERKGENRSGAEKEILKKIFNVNSNIIESKDSEFSLEDIEQIDKNTDNLLS